MVYKLVHRGNAQALRHEMKFHQARAEGRNLFTGYGPGYVSINGNRREASTVVLSDRILDWEVQAFSALTEAAFAQLATLPVEIVLLGTGPTLRFPHPRLTQPLRDARIGLEVMDTSAACRTYNILLSEDRRVAAALLIGARDRPAP
jgi:uncharacterized protein